MSKDAIRIIVNLIKTDGWRCYSLSGLEDCDMDICCVAIKTKNDTGRPITHCGWEHDHQYCYEAAVEAADQIPEHELFEVLL